MKTALAHLEDTTKQLEGLDTRHAALVAALSDVVAAHQADEARNTILLELGWIPAAPALEDVFHAYIKLKDAEAKLSRRGERVPGFFHPCYGTGCWSHDG